MLEGIIALVVIGTIGYFMWQRSKGTAKTEEPEAPYKVESPAVAEVSAPVAEPVVETKEAKPKAKKAKVAKPKTEKAKSESKSKAVKKPKISIAK